MFRSLEELIRWLTVVVGVGVTAAALYALLSTPVASRVRSSTPPVAAPAASRTAHGDIDEASRARLERVLREAEAEEAGR